jgi:hypothetical protein
MGDALEDEAMMHLRCNAHCLTLLLLVAAAMRAEAFQQPPDAPIQRANARLLAAVESLREIVKAERFAIPPEKLREVVLMHLRANEAPIPRVMPAISDLQKDLTVTFDASWSEMLKRATAGLDAAVATELERFLQDNRGLRDSAQANYEQALAKDLPKTLEAVQASLIQEQQQALLDQLRSTVSTTMPSPQQIVEAKDGDSTVTAQLLTDEVVTKMPAEIRPTILVDAYEALKAEAKQVVDDGVTQFSEQLDALSKPPRAVSLPAIQDELDGRIRELVDSQKIARTGNPLRPAYGAFADHLQVPEKARRWFDQRVAAAAADRLTKAAGDKNPFAPAEAARLQRLIVGEPATHHDPAQSLLNAEMRRTVSDILDSKKQGILDDLQQARGRSQNRRDGEISSEVFERSVLNCLNSPNSEANDAWQKLRTLLQQRCEVELLGTIRNSIAQEQSARFSSTLTRRTWRITELQRRAVAIPVSAAELKDLPVWDNGPPRPDESVLSETWNIWIEAADAAAALFDEAERGQHDVVNGLKTEVTAAIGQSLAAGEGPKTLDDWFAMYRDRAQAVWRRSGSNPYNAYPTLFGSTADLIRGIIAELLPQVQDDLESKKQVDMQPADPTPPPVPATDMVRPPVDAQPEPPTDPASPNPANTESEGKGPGMGGEASEESASSNEGDQAGGKGGEKDGDGDGDRKERKYEKSRVSRGGSGRQSDRESPAQQDSVGGDGESERIPVQPRFSDWFFRIAFFVLLLVVVLMALGWFWHVRYLRGLLAQRDRMGRVR